MKTPSDVFKQASDWIELAKVRANPEHEGFGGWRRQAVPVDAGVLRECLDVAPLREHPAWTKFRDELVASIDSKWMRVSVPAIETIMVAMTPETAPKSAKKEMTNG